MQILLPEGWDHLDGYEKWRPCNRCSHSVEAGVILLLSSQIEPTHPDWLQELATQCMLEEIGLVAPRLVHPSKDCVISAGMIRDGDILRSMYESASLEHSGDNHRTRLRQNFTFLHPACVAGERHTTFQSTSQTPHHKG